MKHPLPVEVTYRSMRFFIHTSTKATLNNLHRDLRSGVTAGRDDAFDPRTQEAERGMWVSVSLRPAWLT
uniref:Uncharacterized protein n=1 Tax=Peromyscus maniculatus bairdii TaxID=230844 RepID=A0A8C8W3D2_PERMB